MTSSRYPSVTINGQKSAVFKDPTSKPYGGFVNTTKAGEYPVKQTITTAHGEKLNFTWPSSEHAYHAQKLLHLKSQLPANDPRQKVLTDTLKKIEQTKANKGDEFLPRDDFDPIVKNMIKSNPGLDFGGDKSGFDKMVGFKNYDTFMMDVLKLKIEQNPELKAAAIQMAKDGVMPIECSQYDDKWASGKNGDGKNMLGIMILEIGNDLLKASGGTPAIPDPKAAYSDMQKKGAQALAHNNLVGLQVNIQSTQLHTNQRVFTQQNTSTGAGGRTPNINQQQPSRPGDTLSRLRIATGDRGITATIDKDGRIQLHFSNQAAAQAFANKFGKVWRDGHDPKHFSIGKNQQDFVFQHLNIATHGKQNPRPFADALQYDLKQVQAASVQQGQQKSSPVNVTANYQEVAIPACVGLDQNGANKCYSVANVTRAYQHDKSDSLKLTFETFDDLKSAQDALEKVGINAVIDRPNQETGSKASLSIPGGVKALNQAIVQVNQNDKAEVSTRMRNR